MISIEHFLRRYIRQFVTVLRCCSEILHCGPWRRVHCCLFISLENVDQFYYHSFAVVHYTVVQTLKSLQHSVATDFWQSDIVFEFHFLLQITSECNNEGIIKIGLHY